MRIANWLIQLTTASHRRRIVTSQRGDSTVTVVQLRVNACSVAAEIQGGSHYTRAAVYSVRRMRPLSDKVGRDRHAVRLAAGESQSDLHD
jgi:hypothetical protein